MKRSIRPLCLLLVLLLGMLCVPSVALPAAALEERLGGDEIGYSAERVEAVEGLESIQDITVLANLTSDELSKVDAPYQITSAEGLRLFSELVNSEKNNLRALDVFLTKDIDMNGVTDFVPIGRGAGYAGKFDGQGHTIDGLVLSGDREDLQDCTNFALFDTLGSGAVIQNLILGENCRFEAGTREDICTAAVAGLMRENVCLRNVMSKATVSGGKYSGGLVAWLSGDRYNGTPPRVEMQSCTNSGRVDGALVAGGMIGMCQGGIFAQSCRNAGNVTAETAGGLIGKIRPADESANSPETAKVRVEIGKAENSGNICASAAAGAMVGYLENPGSEEEGYSSELTLDACIHRGGLRGGTSEAGQSPWLGGTETAVEITGISGCTDRSGEIRLHGSQMRQEDDGSYSVRLVGSVRDLEYRELGYRVSVLWQGQQSEALSLTCRVVYRSMLADQEECLAEDLRGEDEAYLCIVAIEDIPSDVGQVEFAVTPYGIRTDGSEETGESYRLVYDSGAYITGYRAD